MEGKCACATSKPPRVLGGIIKPCDWVGFTGRGFFQDNAALIDYVNSQHLAAPLICLGDGHDGVWNILREIATPEERWEILDWYHLKENLYKVGGSLKRLAQVEALLWQGQLDAAKNLLADCRRQQARKFEADLDKHRTRIVNYAYYQAEQLASIGSGAVESAACANWPPLTNFRGQMEPGVREPNVAIEMRVPQWSTRFLTVFA